MKILLCSPYKGAVGGIQRWTNHIIKYYNANINTSEFYIDFYCLGRKKSLVVEENILKRLYSGLVEYPNLIMRFRKKIKKKEFNVVHITSSASISLLKDLAMLKIAKKNGLRTIIHFRFGRIPDLFKHKNWEYRLLIKVVQLADSTIVIDQESYNVLIGGGFSSIELLSNPLTPEISNIIQQNSDIKRIERKILFAGHVKFTKGVFELLEACKDIGNINVKLVGQITEDVRFQIKKALDGNDEWLCIAGEQDYEDTIKEMLSANIFILPTHTEGFPNVILESMACGCPIIASSVGAIPEMLDVQGSTHYGICIQPKNVKQLSSAINKMLNDSKFAQQCGKNAQARVNATYSMPIVWSQMTNIWKTLNN
jgi:glycosyltransferase involved in cell wall biosynthesis